MSDGTKLVAVIGDEDTVTGFILAGIGHRTAEGCNFLVVNSSTLLCDLFCARSSLFLPFSDTPISVIESTFRTLTTRDDIAILLITQQACICDRFSWSTLIVALLCDVDCRRNSSLINSLWQNYSYNIRDSKQRFAVWPVQRLYNETSQSHARRNAVIAES